MSTPPAATDVKGPDLASLSPLITALVTALAAWKLFEPKFARIRAIRAETGRLEPGFRSFYQFPQWLMAAILWIVAGFILLAFLFSFQGEWFAPFRQIQRLVRPDNIIWVIFLAGLVAAAIYWNVLSHILLRGASLISWIPIPGLWRRFGPRGASAGWHQAHCVCQGPDKGAPLLIDWQELNRLSSALLGLVAESAGSQDRADEPILLGESEKANIALFGCILEAAHGANGWPSPDWSEFYASLGVIQAGTDLFSPSTLMACTSGGTYFSRLRNELDAALARRGQPQPPDKALAAEADISTSWKLLTERAKGDVLRLAPPVAKYLGGRLRWLDFRLRSFPRLRGDGMRPQLLKLLVRWNTLPGTVPRNFVQPFAKKQAWLLLQEHVLRALPEVKEVTFYAAGEVPVARIASQAVVAKTVELILHGESEEARLVQQKFGLDPWKLKQEADVTLWEWANSEVKKARDEAWDKSKWRWKFADGRASRLA